MSTTKHHHPPDTGRSRSDHNGQERDGHGDLAGHPAPDSHQGHGQHDDHGAHGGHGGHDKHAGHDPEMFRRLFWWNLLLAVPVLVFSPQIQEWFGYSIDGARSIWRYRDWVIQALNGDKPFDEFVVEQVAGDLLEVLGYERAYSRIPASAAQAAARTRAEFNAEARARNWRLPTDW